ncbi:MAG: ABC transporter permease [Coriobacteriia bacterium]|nr:ABC transporter permease [Coriobacteriia bacterium]
MSVPVAWRNLSESPTRFFISIGGIALAALLVLVLDGVFEGSQRQVTAYIDNSDFDVAVSQRGVKNLHMTTSFFPAERLEEIRDVEGVADLSPILYTTSFLISEDDRSLVYLIGYRPGEPGGPWVEGAGDVPPRPGEVVVDERIAERLGVGIGDEVVLGGRRVPVGGLTRDTVNIVNAIAFVRFEDFERMQGVRGVASYGLVRTEEGASADEVGERIRETVDGVTVQTREEFAESERRIVGDMSVDIMRIMNVFGFLIGLAVVGLTVYSSTLSKLREFGLLKAVGAPAGRLFRVVFGQAAISLTAGLALALALAALVAVALPLAGSNLSVVIAPVSVLRVAASAAVIGLLASAVPIARIVGLDPADVFRR